MTSVQQRLFHPHDTQWPMPNEVWVCWLGLCFADGMFLFQQFARTSKTDSGLLCGKWRNLCHTVALSHSYHSNYWLQSDVGNTPFTGLVMIYKPLRKLICTQRKCCHSFLVSRGCIISLHCTANALILSHMLKKNYTAMSTHANWKRRSQVQECWAAKLQRRKQLSRTTQRKLESRCDPCSKTSGSAVHSGVPWLKWPDEWR